MFRRVPPNHRFRRLEAVSELKRFNVLLPLDCSKLTRERKNPARREKKAVS